MLSDEILANTDRKYEINFVAEHGLDFGIYFSSQAVNVEFVFSKGINEYGKGDRSMRFRIGFKIQVGK